jgi:hypothetical protein
MLHEEKEGILDAEVKGMVKESGILKEREKAKEKES